MLMFISFNRVLFGSFKKESIFQLQKNENEYPFHDLVFKSDYCQQKETRNDRLILRSMEFFGHNI